LYATDCPGYAQAYLNQQCLRDSLYSTQCEGYKTAYAIKYLVGLDSAVTTSVNASLTNTVETQRNDPTNVTGTVDAYSTATGTTSTSSTTAATTSATSVSPVAVISTVKPTAPAPVTATVAQAEPKKDEKKEEAKKDNASPNAGPSNDTKPNDQPKSNREALQERRREAAQKEAVAKGKDLANEMGKAADMESQKAVQNVVIQAMGFTPGFDTYNKAMLPDSRFYKPYTVYGGQVNVDNRNVSRRLMGGSDILHQDMVDSQYKLGDK
jgi:type IV secretory pathway VirB10-like protein